VAGEEVEEEEVAGEHEGEEGEEAKRSAVAAKDGLKDGGDEAADSGGSLRRASGCGCCREQCAGG